MMSNNSEEKITLLVKQLDTVKHIADSGYWLTTEELCLLIGFDLPVLDALNAKDPLFSFAWRNFVCTFVSQQGKANLWAIAAPSRQQIAESTIAQRLTESSPQNVSIASKNALQVENTSQSKSSTLPVVPPLKTQTQAIADNVLPSHYAQIENFLTPLQLESLLAYVCDREASFVSTSTSTNDPDYRRSMFLSVFPEFSELIINRIRAIIPGVIAYLGMPNFTPGQIESQLTAHNDGNFYKIHNDSGSPDTATRELTYVYYFYREPKPFMGGELLIYDSKIENNFYVAASSYKTVKPHNNSIVFFLSRYMHQVLPVSCPSQNFVDSRFTINGWVRRA